MPENDGKQARIEGLATLLVLDEEIRKLANIREFGFFSTNETHRLIPYHTAYLWQLKDFIGTHLVTQSGTAEIDIHAPLNQWLIHKITTIRKSAKGNEIHQIDSRATAEDEKTDVDWPEDEPQYLLWCPFVNKANQVTGGLVFFRESAFNSAEIKMIAWLVSSFQYAWNVLVKPTKIPTIDMFKEKRYLVALGTAIVLFLLFPIRISVLGEGTVIPKQPALINAPTQGVIKSFAVSPGEKVLKGQLLLTLDKTDLKAAAEITSKDYSLTEAKLRTAINQSFESKEGRSEIPVLQAQLAIDRAQYDYSVELLDKTDIKSPIDGVVILDSKEDLIGQPVHTGERILVVADPNKVSVKITLPVTNSITLSIKDRGEFFLYGQLNPLPVQLISLGYNAKLMPNKILAYQFTANFDDEEAAPQIGAQGTVKLYGHRVPMIYYLLRKPLQAIRQTLGI